MSLTPRFLDAGEAALVVEFGTTVDPAIHDQVLALDRALGALAVPGVRETVPTFRSLMIHYDPLVIDRTSLIARVRAAEAAPAPPQPSVHWTMPCCYDGEYGEDLAQIATMTGLSQERVVALHTGAILRIYMYGFVPGFCYLGPAARAADVAARLGARAAPAEHDPGRRRHVRDHHLQHADRLVADRPHARAPVRAGTRSGVFGRGRRHAALRGGRPRRDLRRLRRVLPPARSSPSGRRRREPAANSRGGPCRDLAGWRGGSG